MRKMDLTLRNPAVVTDSPGSAAQRKEVAERVGFEPTLRFPVNRISSAARSTTLPPLREGIRVRRIACPRQSSAGL